MGNFRATTAAKAASLSDGVALKVPLDTQSRTLVAPKIGENVVLPWIGFGTYRIGKNSVQECTYNALSCGYRSIDTAFVYGGETTEAKVGEAVNQALEDGVLPCRSDVFVTTKHWRKYHGYEPTKVCLGQSLHRLQLDYVDLWLMHWPGPAYRTMSRRKEVVEEDPWAYATATESEIVKLRAETWRAMEDAYREGTVRSIGVSNMSVRQLQALKESATLWPPAVNQVELHPLYPQTELIDFCRREGIAVQAYASLGGQDMGKGTWSRLLGDDPDDYKMNLSLLKSKPVEEISKNYNASPAQVLLRYGLEKGCVVIPKASTKEHLLDNAGTLSFKLSSENCNELERRLHALVRKRNPSGNLNHLTRLCWRRDPLRHLDFA